MNIKNDEELPSLERVIAKIIIWIFLIILILPFLSFPTVYAKENGQKIEEIINDIINKHIQKIEKKGYEEVRYILSPIVEKYFTFNNFYEADVEKSILKNYIFYVKYYVISNKDNTLYFKTEENKQLFLKEITKYQKNDYTEKIMWKKIGVESCQDELNKIIEIKKKEYEAALKKRFSSLGNIDTSNAIVRYAIQFNGNPYVSGGTSLTNGADCSGFTQSIFKHFGVSIPRNPAAQANVGQYISWDQLHPGDLVFYSGNGGYSVTHVAIYLGGGKIIHASTPQGGIKVSPVNIMIKMTARRVI